MSALLWLALGLVLGVFLPDRIRLAVKAWVRGAWGWAWGRVGTRAPAPAGAEFKSALYTSETQENASQNSAIPANSARGAPRTSIGFIGGVTNIARFFLGALGWIARNPMLALALVLLALFLVFGRSCSPFGLEFGKSRGQLRLEREIAEMNARIAEHDARLGAMAGQLAENTMRDERRVAAILSQADEEIDHAVEAVDPDALYDVYREHYGRVWDNLAFEGEPDPGAGRTAPVRSPRADRA